MSGESTTQAQPVVLRIRYKCADTATFIKQYANFFNRSGMFIQSRNLQPLGTLVHFELLIENDQIVFSGDGSVAWHKNFDPANPQKTHGMGIRYAQLSPESASFLDKLISGQEKSPKPQPVLNTAKSDQLLAELLSDTSISEDQISQKISESLKLYNNASQNIDELLNFAPAPAAKPAPVAAALTQTEWFGHQEEEPKHRIPTPYPTELATASDEFAIAYTDSNEIENATGEMQVPPIPEDSSEDSSPSIDIEGNPDYESLVDNPDRRRTNIFQRIFGGKKE